jgi:hypothetical protein
MYFDEPDNSDGDGPWWLFPALVILWAGLALISFMA